MPVTKLTEHMADMGAFEMAFRVGQKVVCINDAPDPGRFWMDGNPVNGRIYTVSGFGVPQPYHSESVINLLEVRGSYRASRFRPVVERKTDISIFTAMLNQSKQTVDAQ